VVIAKNAVCRGVESLSLDDTETEPNGDVWLREFLDSL
jgi:hypothetical protein